MVERMVWDHEAEGSSPFTWTTLKRAGLAESQNKPAAWPRKGVTYMPRRLKIYSLDRERGAKTGYARSAIIPPLLSQLNEKAGFLCTVISPVRHSNMLPVGVAYNSLAASFAIGAALYAFVAQR